jgi:coatomer subunit beta
LVTKTVFLLGTKTYFLGEDALANLSVEAGTITEHVRIHSKTQGIALSLGDRITMGV